MRLRVVRPDYRFEGAAGEFTRHDFGQVVIERTGDKRTRGKWGNLWEFEPAH